ncbi:uncharacterized protein PAC_19506 [Phialocephala subalpina]|uniref:Uncharacterized protein n=1 Tax=Phialocephala subalpina TaxID=576137 RepID=A0A1L7XX49_9HELO|nr:uncharacterized protein PAC_19506 [Phialocephala subalpina]
MGHSTSKLACICGQDQRHQIEIAHLNERIKNLEVELLCYRTADVGAHDHIRLEHQEHSEEGLRAEDNSSQSHHITKSHKSRRIGKKPSGGRSVTFLTASATSEKETSPESLLDADLRVIFGYIEILEPNLTAARTAVEAGMKASEELKTLRFELEKEKAASWTATADIFDLEEIIKFQEPLVKVGVAVRRRFIERAKIFWSHNDASADKSDQSVIAAGNEAAHGGNVLADGAMFELKLLYVDPNQCHFQRLYDGGWFESPLLPNGRLQSSRCGTCTG